MVVVLISDFAVVVIVVAAAGVVLYIDFLYSFELGKLVQPFSITWPLLAILPCIFFSIFQEPFVILKKFLCQITA